MRRGLKLLHWLGSRQGEEVKLKDLVDASGLERSTAYRLVAALVDEGFAERDPATKRYKLGLEVMQLGLVAMDKAPLVEKCRIPMRRLARVSGDTVFLVVRHGDYALCLHREEGSFPIRALTTDVGQRRLLGIGAGGRAMLAELPQSDVDAVYSRHAAEFRAAGINIGDLRADIREVRALGYAAMQDLITVGVAGVGCAFRASSSMLAAISIAAISSRLDLKRQRELGDLIRGECGQLAASNLPLKPQRPSSR